MSIVSDRISSLAQWFDASRYLEIEGRHEADFLAVEMPLKVAVAPRFIVNSGKTAPQGIVFMSMPLQQFFCQFPHDPERIPFLENDGRIAFDIIYFGGAHHFQSSFQNFVASLPFAHENTLWILSNTVPCDAYSAIPDRSSSLARRAAAGLGGRPWHGDVYKTVLAIHDNHQEFSYCTILDEGNPQTVIWKHANDGHPERQKAFASPEDIPKLTYDGLLRHAALMMPVSKAILPDIIGMRLDPLAYAPKDGKGPLLCR